MHNHNTAPNGQNASLDTTSAWDMLSSDDRVSSVSYSSETSGSQARPENDLNSFDPNLFSPEKQREVMDSIPAPIDTAEGLDEVMNSLRSKHELRILAYMGGAGFENWDRLGAYSLKQFTQTYPSPADFDKTSREFIDTIDRFNGPEKRAQYEAAMASFKHKIYGAKQTYYEQMQAINTLPSAEQHQIERSAEWTPGIASVSQVSRFQVKQGLDLNRLENIEADQSCQDAYLIRSDEKIFGVFDGAGGHDGGREASYAAAESVDQSCDRYNLKSGSDLAYILNSANQAVRDATEGNGYTTATLAKLVERDGQKILAYAQVGDSRLYLVHSDGDTELITRDEGEGHHLTNALGSPGNHPTKQYGEISVNSGDRVVICSDGITGDYGNDLMTERELGRLVSLSQTPEAASANLVAAARKTDDRTAVVFAV